MGPKCLNNPEKGGVQKLKWPKCLIVHSSRGSGGNRARLCSARESGAHLLKDLCYREQRTNCREGPHIDIVHKKEKKLPKRQGAPDARDRGGPHIDSAQKKKKKLPKRQGASDARDGGEPHIDSMQKTVNILIGRSIFWGRYGTEHQCISTQLHRLRGTRKHLNNPRGVALQARTCISVSLLRAATVDDS